MNPYSVKTYVFNFIHCPMRKCMGLSKAWCTPRSTNIYIYIMFPINHFHFGCPPFWTRPNHVSIVLEEVLVKTSVLNTFLNSFIIFFFRLEPASLDVYAVYTCLYWLFPDIQLQAMAADLGKVWIVPSVPKDSRQFPNKHKPGKPSSHCFGHFPKCPEFGSLESVPTVGFLRVFMALYGLRHFYGDFCSKK